MKLVITTLAVLMISSGAFAAKYDCINASESDLPTSIKFKASLFTKTKNVSVSYSADGAVVNEIIPCSTNDRITLCKADTDSKIERVALNPVMGVYYTIKGGNRIIQFMNCEKN